MAENVNTEPAAPSAQSAATSASSAPPQLQDLPSASPRAVSFSQDSWNPSSNHHRRPSRRRSAQERINDILEIAEAIFGPSVKNIFNKSDARERAEFIAQSSPNNLSPRLQPLLGSSSRIPNYVSSGSPRHGSPRHGSPRHGSPRHGSPRHGSPRHGSPRHGSPRAGSPRLGPVTIQEEATQNGVRNGVITAEPEQLQHFQYPAGTNTDGTTRRRSTRPPVRNLSLSSSHADLGDVTEGRQREESRWKKTLRYFKSIELENKGSVARDHLALERTFLAWLRTSLAFASIGIAITQLFRLNTSLADDKKQSSTLRHLGKPLGATFLGISILILFLGYNRYLESQYWVIRGKFPASRGTIILVSFIAFTVTMASLIVVVAVQRDS